MTNTAAHHHDHELETRSKVVFGFWMYILSDCIMFATIFISYIVLQHNTFGGIGIRQTASLSYVFVQTLILLVSCLTMGFAFACAKKGAGKAGAMFWLLVTLVVGLAFVCMQYHMFAYLYQNGYSWKGSAFLAAFWLLNGAIMVHLLVAALWAVVLLVQFLGQSMTSTMQTRVTCLTLFWNFINVVWVLIFIFVFLMGAI